MNFTGEASSSPQVLFRQPISMQSYQLPRLDEEYLAWYARSEYHFQNMSQYFDRLQGQADVLLQKKSTTLPPTKIISNEGWQHNEQFIAGYHTP